MPSIIVQTRLDTETYRKFKQKVKDMGVTEAELARDYITFGLNNTAIAPIWLELKKAIQEETEKMMKTVYAVLDSAP